MADLEKPLLADPADQNEMLRPAERAVRLAKCNDSLGRGPANIRQSFEVGRGGGVDVNWVIRYRVLGNACVFDAGGTCRGQA